MPVIPKKKKFRYDSLVDSNRRKFDRLTYLSENIPRCKKCARLRQNGMAIPYWNMSSKYLALAEAPGREEALAETPLVGSAGKKWEKEINRLGLEREDFVLINSVQCRPVVDGRNGKPTLTEIENCRFWVNKYIEVIRPEKILAMGNYAVWSLFKTGNTLGGIMGSSGKFIGNYMNIPVWACIHPASLLYHNDNLGLFRKSLKKFKEAK